ncbi:hypothetical protein D0864_02208 [Hortaea werneckii]|uniref:Uncharacterized protein n=1 Tax=Hortaea werneckii TaxID=91943 RepID=A0A3M7H0H0_HORWE|nr:hypothetical protein D0864_02208 [Hortaea werneckii]
MRKVLATCILPNSTGAFVLRPQEMTGRMSGSILVLCGKTFRCEPADDSSPHKLRLNLGLPTIGDYQSYFVGIDTVQGKVGKTKHICFVKPFCGQV